MDVVSASARSTLVPMTERVSCPYCGAVNLSGSEWCTQCYATLGQGEEMLLSSEADVRDERPEETPTAEQSDSAGVRGWTCEFCGEVVSFESERCSVCGVSIRDALGTPRRATTAGQALAASIVPGLGLARAGRPVEAAIVALLVAFGLFGGAALVASSSVAGSVLMLFGLVLWALSARDARMVASGEPERAWLSAGMLTAITAVVLVVVALALIQALPRAVGR